VSTSAHQQFDELCAKQFLRCSAQIKASALDRQLNLRGFLSRKESELVQYRNYLENLAARVHMLREAIDGGRINSGFAQKCIGCLDDVFEKIGDAISHLAGKQQARQNALSSLGDAISRLDATRKEAHQLVEGADAKLIKHAEPVVFIGHGRSLVWRELKDYLADKLNLKHEEFNRVDPAGKHVAERLSEMLDKADFAFVVLTAEDEHKDDTIHARENAIHEVGLFQGRLGFTRAIVLLEDGCHEFSNVSGVQRLQFGKGSISDCFHRLDDILKREGLL